MEKEEALASYRDYVSKNPQNRDAARKSFYKTFGEDPEAKRPLFSGSTGAVATKARPRLATLQAEGAKAGYEQDIANAQAKFVGDVSKAIPVGATLATGGMAAPAAMALMGLSGGVAGGYEETAKLALGATDTSGYAGLLGTGEKKTPSGGAADSPAQLARRLGVEAALSSVGEGGARLTGALLAKAGSRVLEPMIARASQRSDQGKTVLNTFGAQQLNQIRNMFAAAGSPKATIQPEIDELSATIALKETGKTQAFKEAWSNVAQKMQEWVNNGGTAAGLVTLKGEISQVAFKKTGWHFTEKQAFEKFAEKIDRKAASLVTQYGGQEGKALYEGYKATIDQLHRYSAALELVEKTAQRFGYRTAYGFALGTGGAGFGGVEGYRHGGMGGMIAGAAAGALVGASAETAMMAFEKKVAPLLLQHMLADKAAGPVVRKAINQMVIGNEKEAVNMAVRAATQSRIKDWFGEALENVAAENAQKEAPNAAQKGNQ